MHMRLRTTTIALIGLLISGAGGAAALSACSGDDTSSNGGPDASRDVTTDTLGAIDANHPDVQVTDAGACPGDTDAAGLDPNVVAQGLALVKQLGCPNCHQSTPADAGIVLSGRNASLVDGGAIYPPNLTPDKTTGLGCWTDSQITNAILNGIDDQGMKLCVMPKFGAKGPDGGPPRLDDAGAEAVATFLRSLMAVSNQVPETVCPTPPDGGGATDAGADAAADADTDASDAATD